MMIYAVFTFTILMSASDKISLLFVDASETEILKNTVLFLHVSCYFFPILGLLCILRYTIQGAGYTNLAMLSGVSEMIARTLVSIYAVPIFGFLAVCFGDPTAWIAADLFLVPAFIYVYRKLKRALRKIMQSPTVRLRTAVWNNRGSDRMYVSRNLMYTGYNHPTVSHMHPPERFLPSFDHLIEAECLRTSPFPGIIKLASVGQRSTVMDRDDIRQFR